MKSKPKFEVGHWVMFKAEGSYPNRTGVVLGAYPTDGMGYAYSIRNGALNSGWRHRYDVRIVSGGGEGTLSRFVEHQLKVVEDVGSGKEGSPTK